MNVNDFMAGAGRFGTGDKFRLVQEFFAGAALAGLAAGSYTKAEIGNQLGIDRFAVALQAWEYDDEIDDYAERTFIWNSQGFSIAEDAEFKVHPDGRREILNFGIEPATNVEENFDFGSGDWLANLGQIPLERSMDPWGIGRKVDINFIDSVHHRVYSIDDFYNDVLGTEQAYQVAPLIAKLASGIKTITDDLFASGITRFLDQSDRAIKYGSVESESVVAASVTTGIAPYLGSYAVNGVVLLGGPGDDLVVGGEKSDVLKSGQGNDTLVGGVEADSLVGGRAMTISTVGLQMSPALV